MYKDRKGELLACLPDTVKNACFLLQNKELMKKASELRLRRDRVQSLTVGKEAYILSRDGLFEKQPYAPVMLTEKQLRDSVERLCDGSVFACSETIRYGFVTKCGCRVGISGKAVTENGKICGFREYDALNIRFSRHIPDAAAPLLRFIAENGFGKIGGILLVSPPGIGKTTMLRSLCAALASGFSDGGTRRRARVFIADEREEIYMPEVFEKTLCDFLSDCPKAQAIELATRVLSPEFIVCDEIGNDGEADAVLRGASGGIVFIAACHGNSIEELYQKRQTARLLREGVFGTVCILSEQNGMRRCTVQSVRKGATA